MSALRARDGLRAPVRGRLRIAAAFGLALSLACSLGCGGLWERVRHHEHAVSWSHAHELAESNRCDAALLSIERAQIERSLTRRFAAETTWLKARCLERLGRRQEALAHYRFIRDFLPDSPSAESIPLEVRAESRAKSDPPSQWIPPRAKLPTARYTRAALSAGIAGQVKVYYSVDPEGVAVQIRVTADSHPLLASWVIEAVARGEFAVPDQQPQVSTEALAVFRFRTRKDVADASDSESGARPVALVQP